MKYSLDISNFLEVIPSLSHSVVYLYFFALIAEEGFLILLAILWYSAFKWKYLSFSPLLFASLHFTAICKASSDNLFAFLHSFSMGMVLIPSSCTVPCTKLSSGHRTGKGQFSFQSLRKAIPKNAQTTAQLHSSHTLVK